MAHELVWGARDWAWVAGGAGVVMLLLLFWGYAGAASSLTTRLLAAALKALGIAVLAVCLLEPLFSGTRVRPGANSFVILADNSQSMMLRDRSAERSRAEEVKAALDDAAPWSAQLREDFDVRRYAYDSQLRAVSDYRGLAFDGGASALGASLDRLVRRYQGRALAGIMLLSDGNATDTELLKRLLDSKSDPAAPRLPPIYPVLIGGDQPAGDVSIGRVAIAQTSFEDAPVSLSAQVKAIGYNGRKLVVQLLDEKGEVVDRQQVIAVDDSAAPALAVRFQVKPARAGLSFYQLRVAAEGEEKQFDDPAKTAEATLENNTRLVVVDRGQGPYEVLYVSGRPNWEFKYLRRALEEDDQVRLVGLIRIAKREPKFSFRSRVGEETNPLFRGFDPKDKEQVEQHDQPVIVRLGTKDEAELRDGFPKAPEDLYRYHAIVIDDLEAEFFTQDQLTLVKDFVRQRGGGLLMLGGQESFKNGKFERTPIGDLLPVYLDDLPPVVQDARYQIALTREGWLEPWIRLRAEENTERKRLHEMPTFHTLNRVRGIKPGATVLVTAAVEGGKPVPALVEQRFGRGRAGAILLGDLWRWGLRRVATQTAVTQTAPPPQDLEKSWRQTIRWLVSDVPRRVELHVDRAEGEDVLGGPVRLLIDARDEKYAPLENATVTLRVTGPDNKPLELTAEPSDQKPGVYETAYVPRQPGAFRATATVKSADGSDVGEAASGWTSQPAANEFADLRANRELLSRLAEQTGGEVVAADDIDRFVASLPTRAAEITEPYVVPLWHRPGVFLLAIGCLVAEWGLRRWKGLP
jgi:uncharacterized membrane protein